MSTLSSVAIQALMITAFVAAMMILIEYVNVQSRGLWIRALGRSRWRQYVVAAALGALPGCLGAYVVVALYAHRRISLGAVVATMIATSGDETFVMLALFPGVALAMTLGLLVVGVGVGALTDQLFPRHGDAAVQCDEDFTVHGVEQDRCQCLPDLAALRETWRRPKAKRVILSVVVIGFLMAVVTGVIGPPSWNWKRLTFSGLSLFVLFVVTTVPDHFLSEHLWRHVVRSHALKIFAWTFGTLAVLALLTSYADLDALVQGGRWVLLGVALLIGIIPESGPHLIFVTLFASGVLPLGVLVASSAAQDGHGMLPLLAESRADFIRVKLINIAAGGLLGALMLLGE